MDRQVCVIKAVAYSLRTDFYFKTVIIGGPIQVGFGGYNLQIDYHSNIKPIIVMYSKQIRKFCTFKLLSACAQFNPCFVIFSR